MNMSLPVSDCPTAQTRAGAVDRRRMLKLFVSGAALALASCGPPREEIVPYVNMPERQIPGVPLQFATALALAGYARGVVVSSVDGRPIKIEGNPRHPASLGATDVYAEATLLSLYDPDRSRAAFSAGRVQPWTAFETALRKQLDRESSREGSGLALLTGRITSPTALAQIEALKAKFPQFKSYRYEPVEDDAIGAGAMQAFGRSATALPRFNDARVALMLDADPVGYGPQQIRFAHDIVAARHSHNPQDSFRLYAAEPAWTLTGALADHRLPLRPELIGNVAIEIARALGAPLPQAELPTDAAQFAKAAAADLTARRGAAVVLAGPRQAAGIHALCHWINHELGAPIDFIAPVDEYPGGHGEALRNLADDLHARRVSTLVVIAANPAYDAPGDLAFTEALAAAPFSTHLGLYNDETAARCTWHLPMTHVLESWSDIRAFDGTASVIQPLIRPLYDTRTAHELIALLGGTSSALPYTLVRDYWQAKNTVGDFTDWWRQTLEEGVVDNTAAAKIDLPAPALPQIAPASGSAGWTLTFAPDPSVFDGSMANNAWLQECPTPFTKQVWGNAVHLPEDDARGLGLVDGDVVRLSDGQRVIEAPILVRAGQAPRTAAATLGHGRMLAGSIGSNIGFDVYPLRRTDSPWLVANVTVNRSGRRENVLLTQHNFQLDGEAADLQPRFTLADLAKGDLGLSRPGDNPPTLYPPRDHDTYEWAMVIDNSACVGCNACVVACQAENNVPIVGPDEIAQGRDMHWLRVDDYVVGGRPGFSPVPCMHCEHAPCEPVCPVAASVHDGEGLNVQVYNRCIGTRFCQSNCPYKVRRFNFFGYADGDEYRSFGKPIVKAVFNPDVTVRARGVMEKCTYCVQRISHARRAAEKEHRTVRDREVVTACQAACPTRAIAFGDLSSKESRVNALRAEPHAYALLGHLGTRPRTTYLARLQNPNPDFQKAQS
jgi:molybdopterin-containing oxidoreductase family iron-sulfur binding subunit